MKAYDNSRPYLNDTAIEQAVAHEQEPSTLLSMSSIALTLFASINEAAFSFVGMLFLLSGTGIPTDMRIGLALGSGLAALSIESEVFYENICTGLKYALTRDGLRLKIVRDIILEKYNADPNTDDKFLTQYANHYIELEKLLAHHDHGTKNPEKERQKKILQFELMQMDLTLLQYFQNPKQSKIEASIKESFETLFENSRQEFHNTYDRKNLLLQISTIFNLLSLPGCFFAASFMAKGLLVAAGATGTILSGGVFTIALIACASFFVMMYNTFSEMIYNDLLQRHYNQLKQIWFNLDEDNKPRTWKDENGKEHTWCWQKKLLIRSMVILTCALFAGLIVFLTLATAGTWIQCGISGQAIYYSLTSKLLTTTIAVSAGLYTAITVIFNIKNIMATISFLFSIDYLMLGKKLLLAIASVFTKPAAKLFGNESKTYQYPMLCLFAAIAYTLQVVTTITSAAWFVVTLLAHCVSEGVTTDKGYFISTFLSALSNAVAEFFTDVPYIIDCNQERTLEMGKKLDPNYEAAHKHTGVLGKLFFLAMSPILLLNYAFYRLIADPKTAAKAWDTQVLAFWNDHHHEPENKAHEHKHEHEHEHGHKHDKAKTHDQHSCGHEHKPSALPALSGFWNEQIKKNVEIIPESKYAFVC